MLLSWRQQGDLQLVNDDDHLDLCEQKCAAVNRSVGTVLIEAHARVMYRWMTGSWMHERSGGSFIGLTRCTWFPPLLHCHRIRKWRNVITEVIIGNSFARIVTLKWTIWPVGLQEEGEGDALIYALLRWLVFKLQFSIPKKFVVQAGMLYTPLIYPSSCTFFIRCGRSSRFDLLPAGKLSSSSPH